MCTQIMLNRTEKEVKIMEKMEMLLRRKRKRRAECVNYGK